MSKSSDKEIRSLCDGLIEQSAELMITRYGASIEILIDRMLTYAVAQICFMHGKKRGADVLRQLAANVDAGAFDSLTARDEGKKH